jgi:histidyl-tRNA synthetase
MYQAPRGTHDVLPEDAHYWRYVEECARRLAEQAGYRELRTPMFEETNVFLRGVGETTDIVEKEMYTFLDKGGNSMTLRPEATAGIVRAYLEHGMGSRPQPVKVYALIQAFRYDRPSKGRFRQFHQLDLEAIGEADALVDAELVAWQWRFYATLGLRNLSLHVNSIGDQVCRPGYVAALREYFERHEAGLCADCRRRLRTNPLRLLDDKTPACQPILDAAPRSVDYLCGPCREHFDGWLAYLRAADVPFEVDHRLVRGLDYYTRAVWEIMPPLVGAQSTIGGGGRYDGLAELLGSRAPVPGTGFATGIERIIAELKDQQVDVPPAPPPAAYVVYQHAGAKATAFRVAEQLRAAGVSADLAFGDRSLRKQMAAAARSGARLVLILGDDELASGTVSLKDLRDGQEQRSVAQAELVPVVRELTEARS